MPKSTTVILGAGFGGLATANALRARLHSEHRIVVVDRSKQFTVGAGQTWVMLGLKKPEEIGRPIAALARRGVEIVTDEVKAIEAVTRTVTLARGGALAADFLVLALGAQLELDAVPGLGAAHTFFTLDGALKLREALASFSKGSVVLAIPRSPFKCPPAPYEAAMLLAEHFEKKKLRKSVTLSVYTVEPAPMPTAGPQMGQFISELLERAGITLRTQHKLTKVDSKARMLTFEGGAQVPYDLLIAIPPHRVPAIVSAAGLAVEGGWVPVDPKTLLTRHERVWAVGDMAAVPLPGRFKPDAALVLPKAGVFAAREGEQVAAQIAGEVHGRQEPGAFDGKGFCFIEVGGEKAVRGEGDFFALPHPNMAPRGEPDGAQLADKHSWVRGVLDPQLGP